MAGLEAEYNRLSDSELRYKTAELKGRIAELEAKIIGPDLREKLREVQLLPSEARTPAKRQLISPVSPVLR